MKKVYVLFKTQSQEGNFGDCEDAPSTLCGVFLDEPAAVLAKIKLEQTCYKQEHQFGSHQQTIIMQIVEVNKIVELSTNGYEIV